LNITSEVDPRNLLAFALESLEVLQNNDKRHPRSFVAAITGITEYNWILSTLDDCSCRVTNDYSIHRFRAIHVPPMPLGSQLSFAIRRREYL
jgi:hypothetical protein